MDSSFYVIFLIFRMISLTFEMHPHFGFTFDIFKVDLNWLTLQNSLEFVLSINIMEMQFKYLRMIKTINKMHKI